MFFSVSLSRNGLRLSYHMSYLLRGCILFLLVSILLMFLFSFTTEDFRTAGTLGKINIIVLPILLALGSLYRFTVVFDRQEESIEVHKGLLIWFRTERYDFSDLQQLVVQRIHAGRLDPADESRNPFPERVRYIFGFRIAGKTILIERAARKKHMEMYYSAFKAFYPRPVPEV